MSSLFKIYSPEDCDFYYDGEYQGHISGNSDKAFRFEVERKGTYRVRFVNSRYKSELRKNLIIGVDEEQDVDLDFTEVNAAFVRAEEEKERQHRLRKEAEEAERKRIELEEATRRRRIEEEKRRELEAAERMRIEAERRKAIEEEKAERKRRTIGLTFHEGLARFEMNNKWTFIDNTGREITPFKYDDLADFENGYAKVSICNKWGFIDNTGREITPIKYEEVEDFKGEFAKVKCNDKWGVIDMCGKEVAPCIYDLVCGFSNNKFLVIVKGEFMVILKTAKGFTPAYNHFHGEFDDVAIGVNCVNQKKSLIDRVGGNVTPCIYDEIYLKDFGAIVKKDRKSGLLDKRGNEILPCEYDSISVRSDRTGMLEARKNNKLGLYDKNGKQILPCIYDEILGYYDFLSIKKGQKYGLIDIYGREVYPCISSDVFFRTDYQAWYIHLGNGRYRKIDRYLSNETED